MVDSFTIRHWASAEAQYRNKINTPTNLRLPLAGQLEVVGQGQEAFEEGDALRGGFEDAGALLPGGGFEGGGVLFFFFLGG